MIRVLELFAGIGACSKALERLGIEHEIVDAVEIDKFAIASFNAIHGTNFEPQDIKKWNKDIKVDLIMHGSPCQDFSLAGKQAGGDKDSGTRSSLMYETLRIVEKLKPQIVIWENVKNILSQRHVHNWDAYAEYMEELGYTNYCQILNAKDYGIPQNRERVFTISILDYYDEEYHSFLAHNFNFPKPIKLEKKLKDFLEEDVDESFNVSKKQLQGMINTNYQSYKLSKLLKDKNGMVDTIKARFIGCPQLVIDESVKPSVAKNFEKEKEQIVKSDREMYQCKVTSGWSDNVVGLKIAPTLRAGNSCTYGMTSNCRIRKLTPKECWRLMGFDDEDFDKASKICSNAQLYKQAGNSIVVNVMEEIFKELLNCKISIS